MRKALLLFGAGISLFAQADPLPLSGQKLQPSHVDVRFAPAEQLAARVRVYKVVPQHFAPSIISNVMVLGGFMEKNRKAPPPQERGTINFSTNSMDRIGPALVEHPIEKGKVCLTLFSKMKTTFKTKMMQPKSYNDLKDGFNQSRQWVSDKIAP